MTTIILGDGPMGRAVADAARDRGEPVTLLGRPPTGRHPVDALAGSDVVVDASRGEAVIGNVAAAVDGGVRHLVIATTGWSADRADVDAMLREHGVVGVAASNFSLGVALFARLVEAATDLFGAVDAFDPYLVEWHRRTKADRPSGTALDLARRVAARHPRLASPADIETVSIRAGASPGMHLVGFDAAGETIELRITARDRTAYAAGVMASADWLRADRRTPGLHPFDPVVDDLIRHQPMRPDRRTSRPRRRPAMTRSTTPATRPTSARPVRPSRPVLRGAITALVTPFTPDGAIDEAAFRRLVRWQAMAGIDGLVPCGTTGEAPTLSPAEREWLIGTTVEVVGERASRARIPVIAGTGTNDTRATIAATRQAAALGADAALVVAPYYNRPDARMLEAHFRAVADEGDLPIVVYNVPSRTGANVDAGTFLRLAEHPRIVAVKEASGNLEQIARICRERPRGVAVLAGDDAWTLPILALGGDGVVSVASNEIPGELVRLCAAARAGDWDTARWIHERWLPLFLANFAGAPNPVPAKAALALMGLLESDAVRAPLLPMDADGRAAMAVTLRTLGLVEAGGGRIGLTSRAAVA